MKRFILTVFLCMMILAPSVSSGQELVVSGTVTDVVGNPLIGANVQIIGTNFGAATRSAGDYRFVVPALVAQGQELKLKVSFIGYHSQTVPIRLTPGQQLKHDFKMEEDVLELESIIVTGLGVETKEKLGVTIARVKPQIMEQADQSNLVSALSGKVANVEITKTSGDAGTNTYIKIRGTSTIDRGNQPLFVVDGTPISNATYYTNGFNGGTEAQNRAGDLNIEDIASVEILKGAAASAIYGSRASNGVILITTKTGKPGRTRISYKTVYGTTEQTKDYPLQTWYGQGTKGKYRKNYSRSWGQPLNVRGAPHYDSALDYIAVYGADTLMNVYDHTGEVTDGGYNVENNITISGGNELTTFFASFGQLYEKGHWIAGSDYKRLTGRIKATHLLTPKIKMTGNLAYAYTNAHYLQRGDNAIGMGIATLRTPPEFNNLPYLHPETGFHRSYRYSDAQKLKASRKFDNPFFIMYEHDNPATVNRVYGNSKLEYDLTNWAKFDYTFGIDYFADERMELVPISSSREAGVGRIIKADYLRHEYDGTALLTIKGNKFLKKYKNFDGTFMLGHNINSRRFRRFEVTGVDMGVPGFNQLDNTVSTNLQTDEFESLIHTESYFGQATFDVYDQLYLTAAFRNEGSSTFGASQKRHWYPKFSAAWDFNKFRKVPFIDFGKLRIAYGVAGVQPSVYSTITGYASGIKGFGWGEGLNPTYRGLIGVYSSSSPGNNNIKPERTKEIEMGTNLAFWDSRLGLDITYYKARSEDVLFDLNLVPSTGFFDHTANAAIIENKGWEITADLTALRKRNFQWNIGFNYAANKNIVVEMGGVTAEDIKTDPGAEVWEQIGRWAYASPGRELGEMRLQSWVRFGYDLNITENGQNINIDEAYAGQWKKGDIYVGADGYPVMHNDNLWSGFDSNPDWTGGLRNEIKLFNKLTISALLDIKRGFYIMNHGKGALYSYGTHEDTKYRGTIAPVDGGTTTDGSSFSFFKHGEKAIGPGAGQAVEWNETFYRGIASGFSGDGWLFIEDGSYVKLREIAIGYRFDQPFIKRLGLEDITVRLSGRNLKTWTDYTGYDPESNRRQASDQRDSDYFNQPQTRSFNVTFYVNY